jgi:hypothetical protein
MPNLTTCCELGGAHYELGEDVDLDPSKGPPKWTRIAIPLGPSTPSCVTWLHRAS